MATDDATASDAVTASMSAISGLIDQGRVMGTYEIECHGSDGVELWRMQFDNLVTTVGKNAMENQALSSSAYTSANFMGLISSASFTAVAAADTMASHSGWLEAGATNSPHYSGSRATLTFGAAAGGVISTSAPGSFVFTNSGTVQGAFICFGAGAVSTIDSTAGILLSAGTIASPQPVISGNTVTVGYTLTLT